MAETTSDFLITRMHEWGIRRVFGYPGDGINGVMGALRRAPDKIDFIQVPHEENAAFMACGHAKFTGEPGVCIATSGPGAIHLLNGLYDAKMDHQPVVAIIGQQARAAIGGSYQQEVDLLNLFKDVAHEYVQMVTQPQQLRHVIDRAFRIAQSERTVTCIILPNDLQELTYKEPERIHGSVHSSTDFSYPVIVPQQNDLKKAAEILNNGKKIAILIGAGARNAADEIITVADILGAGVAKALLGKDVIPDGLPFVTGAIGLLGTRASWDLMADCDTLFMIGSGFPYSEFLPKDGKAKGVQIDIDGRQLGIRYPMDINLQGDSKETLKLLIPLLIKKEDRSWQKQVEKNVSEGWKVLKGRAMQGADPVNPQRVFWELSSRLPDDCIITADSGSSANWFARDIQIRKGMRASLSGNLATMCPSIPYSIAAKFAFPDRVPVALIGDGAMQMLGNNGLITIAKYRSRWKDPRFIIVVLNNGDLNHVTWEQRIMEGDAKFEGSENLINFPFAEYSKILGIEGIKIDREEDIVSKIEEAMACKGPVLIEVIADPTVPPLPPHITFDQAKNFGISLLKGDVDAWQIIKNSVKQVKEGFHL